MPPISPQLTIWKMLGRSAFLLSPDVVRRLTTRWALVQVFCIPSGEELGSNLLHPFSSVRWYRLLSTMIEVADGPGAPGIGTIPRGKLSDKAAS